AAECPQGAHRAKSRPHNSYKWISPTLTQQKRGLRLPSADSQGSVMSQTRQKSSPTDEHARRIARAISKGQPPPFSADLDRYCESLPHEIFAAFAGAVWHMPPAGKDEALALGYLFVLQLLLEHLRYRTDRGYADATQLIADFQADVAARVEAGQVDGCLLAFVAGALHQSKIAASPELAAASAKLPADRPRTKRSRPTFARRSAASSKSAAEIRSWRSAR